MWIFSGRFPALLMLVAFVLFLFPASSAAADEGQVDAFRKTIATAGISEKTGVFHDIDGKALSYEAFILKLQTGHFAYAIRSDGNNKAISVSLVPRDAPAEVSKEAVTVGRPAPGFSVISVEGKTYTLSELGEKVVVLKFGSEQCGACQEDWTEIKNVALSCAESPVVFFYMEIGTD